MENLIFKVKFGSHLYGTNTPESDTDYKGVYIPNADDIILQRVRGSIHQGPSKDPGAKNSANDVDIEIFSVQRYLQLLAEGQTGAIDMLFAPNPEIVTEWWHLLKMNKNKLLTKKSAAFLGYCRQQANKYGIKGSRVAAAKAASEVFQNISKWGFGLHKVGEFTKYLDPILGEHTKIETLETTPGHFETYFECCNRKVGYKNTVKEAAKIFTAIYNEYGERARKAESNEGIDWKALSHAVRVGGEALELLNTGHVTFPLPNAEHIKDIKLGKIVYKEVAEEIEELLVKVEDASKTSTLRDEADYDWIDEFVRDIYEEEVILGILGQ